MGGYQIQFYVNSQSRKRPVENFLRDFPTPAQIKIAKYIEHLRANNGYLDEPYSRHIIGKIRELRVDFRNTRHRLLYFTFINKKIILLHGFIKKTTKTPTTEINQAVHNYNDAITNPQIYE